MKTEPRLVGNYLGGSYAELQNLIRAADAKANILIAIIGAILSLFFSFIITKNTAPIWQVIIVLALFFISGGFALSTLYPRISKKSGKFSLIYYKDAININTKDTTKDFINKNQEEKIIEDYINSIKSLSLIVNKKFIKLQIAYIVFGLAVILKIIFEIYLWLL